MKKKLKDLTFEEYLRTCDKQPRCFTCPFDPYCGSCLSAMNNIRDDLEKEVEVDE